MKQNTYKHIKRCIKIAFCIEITIILMQSDFYAIIKILQYCFEIFTYSILCSVFCLFVTRKKLKKNKKR